MSAYRKARWSIGAAVVAFAMALSLVSAAAETPVETVKGPKDPDDPTGNDINLYTERSEFAGHQVSLRVRSADADKARAAIAAAKAEMGRVLRKFDASSPSSEISSINHIAAREEVLVSTETETLLTLALKFCRTTDRGFDPTMASFGYLWNLQNRPFVPPLADEVAARLALTGCDKLALKPGRRVRLTEPAVRIDLADMVKGHALQRASAILTAHGLGSHVLRIDQDRYVLGRNGTRYWYTPLHHPFDPTVELMQVYVGSHAIATRTVRDRSILRHGVRFHDVLDPATGYPATEAISATVISPDPALADAMSRALLAIGPTRGMAMLSKISQQIEAVVIDRTGVVHATAGMKNIAPKLPARIRLKTTK